MSKKNIFLFVIFLFVVSCHQSDIYFQYKNIPQNNWHKDSSLIFNCYIEKKEIPYNIYLHIRHQGNYPYQNMWLFLQQDNPDSVSIKDSVEVFLANQYGKWLGSGAGSLKEMPVLYKQSVYFPDTGTYDLEIKQGMRDDLLRGISSVGVRIENANGVR
ncbi:MAG: gliding motility lipoprotein GldH [Paludibacteraceae bacterium]